MSELEFATNCINGKTWFLYVATNTINRRVYVGLTKSAFARKANHLFKLLKNQHPNKELQADYNLKHLFTWKVEEVYHTKEEAIKGEMNAIIRYGEICYNKLSKNNIKIISQLNNNRPGY